jgi:hypothetical protein
VYRSHYKSQRGLHTELFTEEEKRRAVMVEKTNVKQQALSVNTGDEK